MGPFLSLTHWWCHSLTSPSSLICIESPHIQIYTCSGTVTTTWLLNSVPLTHSHTEPRLSAPVPNCWMRKKTTSKIIYLLVLDYYYLHMILQVKQDCHVCHKPHANHLLQHQWHDTLVSDTIPGFGANWFKQAMGIMGI